ncbi:MAG: hypothetical protein KBE65_22980 [Phycisphaerae bacterium]|nr:hypothetical protein [Phycisphaerae bacterium]
MRALYSLVCRVRTLCALTQGMVTLAIDGWAALAPVQLMLLGCGLCLLLRIVVPSPPSDRRRGGIALLDPLLSGMAAGSIVVLTTAGFADSGLLFARLAMGL